MGPDEEAIKAEGRGNGMEAGIIPIPCAVILLQLFL